MVRHAAARVDPVRTRRRALLGGAAAVGAATLLRPGAWPAGAAEGPILKPLPPEWFTVFGTNAEMRWDSVDPGRFLTTQRRLFVCDHTRTPTIDPQTYRLAVFGDGLAPARPGRVRGRCGSAWPT